MKANFMLGCLHSMCTSGWHAHQIALYLFVNIPKSTMINHITENRSLTHCFCLCYIFRWMTPLNLKVACQNFCFESQNRVESCQFGYHVEWTIPCVRLIMWFFCDKCIGEHEICWLYSDLNFICCSEWKYDIILYCKLRFLIVGLQYGCRSICINDTPGNDISIAIIIFMDGKSWMDISAWRQISCWKWLTHPKQRIYETSCWS